MQNTLREWLEQGEFHLALSAGYFGFYAHVGFLSALVESGLRPASVSGSSAGALVAGAWASGVEVGAIRDELFGLRRSDFWDPGPGLGLLKGERLERRLDAILPRRAIEACAVPLSISGFDVWRRRTHVFRTGGLARAIRASCALPLLFRPVWIDGRPLLDGGIRDRPGVAGVEPERRVLAHHLRPVSFWRKLGAPAGGATRGANRRAVTVAGLPKVDPFHLDRGREAYEVARRETLRALDRGGPA